MGTLVKMQQNPGQLGSRKLTRVGAWAAEVVAILGDLGPKHVALGKLGPEHICLTWSLTWPWAD